MSLLLLLSFSSALAAPPPGQRVVDPFEEPDESELFALDEQLVTVASKYAQTLRKAPNIVSLITADQIRERGYRTVSDALRELPGIYVWKSKEGRDLAAFRGVISADNNKILILVDGVPWYDGVYTHAFIDDYMPISNIRQIEVIKGPGSAIYGTNAFAGVINVVTWSGAELDGARFRWTGGATGRSELTAMVGGHSRGGIEFDTAVYARVLSQLGDGLDLTPRDRVDIAGSDPRRGIAVGGRLQVEQLSLQLHHVDYQQPYLVNEADNPYDLWGKHISAFDLYYHDTFFSGRYRFQVNRDFAVVPYLWSQRHDNPGSYFFDLGYSVSEPDPGEFQADAEVTMVETEKDTRRWGAGIDIEARPGLDHVTVAGLGVETVHIIPGRTMEIIDGNGDYVETQLPGIVDLEYSDFSHNPSLPGFQGQGTLRNLFAYGQHAWTVLPELEITAGGRFDMRIPANELDDPSAKIFKPHLTPRIGVLLVPNELATIKLLYGSAFRSPNARELRVRSRDTDDDGYFDFTRGTEDLLPEQIHTVEAEADIKLTQPLSLRFAGSYSQVLREIDKISPPDAYWNMTEGQLDIIAGEAEIRFDTEFVDANLLYAGTYARYSADARFVVDLPASPGFPTEDPTDPWDQSWGGFLQFEFPPHMVKGSVQVHPTGRLTGTVFGEWYSYRPRIEWTPDSLLDDGRAFALVHLAVRAADLGPDGRFELGIGMRNLLDSAWGTGMYRDDANVTTGPPDNRSARYPNEMEGEGRSVFVALEGRL